MTHYRINHINDVLPHVEGRSDFIVADKGDYIVIDYVYAGSDTFDHPARVECRGLKFAPDGKLLARPLHKFRNIGETPELLPSVLDFNQPHTVMDKLDGSMIHACMLRTGVAFMTRMGRTDVALACEDRHLTSAVENACHALLMAGCPATPIFEWTAPDNRIVVRYNESRLTLLAIRNTASGTYYPRQAVADWAEDMCIPHVTHHNPRHTNAADFLAYARTIQGAEGFVVRFDNGLWVKAKGEDYVLRHRAKDDINREKNILALVMNGGLDDVVPLLDEGDAEAARTYAAAVESGIAETAENLARLVADNSNVPQKDFALNVVPALDPALRGAAFLVRAGKPAREVIRERIAANTNSQSQVDKNRALHGATWRTA